MILVCTECGESFDTIDGYSEAQDCPECNCAEEDQDSGGILVPLDDTGEQL